MEENIHKRLAMWKRQYLAKGGRLTLVKRTLSSLPIYHTSLFVSPKKVSCRIEKIQRGIFWGGRSLEKKTTLCEIRNHLQKEM